MNRQVVGAWPFNVIAHVVGEICQFDQQISTQRGEPVGLNKTAAGKWADPSSQPQLQIRPGALKSGLKQRLKLSGASSGRVNSCSCNISAVEIWPGSLARTLAKDNLMSQLCESCEREPQEIVETCDNPQEPYRLCSGCHQRLKMLSLRPLEWYNLAKRFGPNQFLLHDDFYDEDGAACQPEEDVQNAGEFPAPILAEVIVDPEKLLDYSIARWHFSVELVAAWKTKESRTVLSTVSARFYATSNLEVRATVLSVCAAAANQLGAEFVRDAWKQYPEKAALIPLAEASAACLPNAEGIEKVEAALADLEGNEKRDQMFCLSYFHSRRALTWIERNICEPVTESWGNLAAASDFNWSCVESWLGSGRPLSLVAIDALAAIVQPMTLFLREYKPALVEPPTHSRFREVLLCYRRADAVPRVQKRIDALFAKAGEPILGLTNG